jgi:hypothetical protein
MPRSMNDAMVWQLLLMHQKATWEDLFKKKTLHNGIEPCIIRGKGYPLYPWLMCFTNKLEFHILFLKHCLTSNLIV